MRSNVENGIVDNDEDSLVNDDVTIQDMLLHVRSSLSQALKGLSLDNISQIYAVVNNPAVGNLISLEHSSRSCLRDELVAILHQQISWYHCSGQDGQMLLLQDLLQKLEHIPTKKLIQLICVCFVTCC